MFKTLAAAALVAPFLVESVFAADCSRTYTVQQGDICDSISAAQNVSTYQLSVVNSGVIDNACSNLTPGSSICLGWTGEDCSNTYSVQKDDTCSGIQNIFNINSTILYLNNPQINDACDNIYIGEVLCIGSTVQVPPAPSGWVPPAIPATATFASAPTPPPAPFAADSFAPTPASSSDSGYTDDEDDEDLPYCDEL